MRPRLVVTSAYDGRSGTVCCDVSCSAGPSAGISVCGVDVSGDAPDVVIWRHLLDEIDQCRPVSDGLWKTYPAGFQALSVKGLFDRSTTSKGPL